MRELDSPTIMQPVDSEKPTIPQMAVVLIEFRELQ
jgi:hypothetical protein